ncbi:lycopene cyclase domain-containing protein [Candidatus Gottesmanbacteria bacterium]|nr:lycopene cyclase domain-containing protein [Candidatus Gottesmanbacteria bacterium]
MNYLIWLFIFVWIPTIVLWTFKFPLLWRYKKTLLYAMIFAVVFSFPWDVIAIHLRIWYFPNGKNLGIKIFEVPLEELLFMMTVTLLIGSITILLKYKKDYKRGD